MSCPREELSIKWQKSQKYRAQNLIHRKAKRMKVWLDSLDKALLGAAIVRRKKVTGAISYPIDTLLLIDESLLQA